MSIKRPAVLLAAFFVFSAFCAVSNADIAAIAVSALLVGVASVALIKKKLRLCALAVLGGLACSYAVVFAQITERSVDSRLELVGNAGRFCAITQDVSVYGDSFTVYAEITKGPLRGERVVVNAKTGETKKTGKLKSGGSLSGNGIYWLRKN